MLIHSWCFRFSPGQEIDARQFGYDENTGAWMQDVVRSMQETDGSVSVKKGKIGFIFRASRCNVLVVPVGGGTNELQVHKFLPATLDGVWYRISGLWDAVVEGQAGNISKTHGVSFQDVFSDSTPNTVTQKSVGVSSVLSPHVESSENPEFARIAVPPRVVGGVVYNQGGEAGRNSTPVLPVRIRPRESVSESMMGLSDTPPPPPRANPHSAGVVRRLPVQPVAAVHNSLVESHPWEHSGDRISGAVVRRQRPEVSSVNEASIAADAPVRSRDNPVFDTESFGVTSRTDSLDMIVHSADGTAGGVQTGERGNSVQGGSAAASPAFSPRSLSSPQHSRLVEPEGGAPRHAAWVPTPAPSVGGCSEESADSPEELDPWSDWLAKVEAARDPLLRGYVFDSDPLDKLGKARVRRKEHQDDLVRQLQALKAELELLPSETRLRDAVERMALTRRQAVAADVDAPGIEPTTDFAEKLISLLDATKQPFWLRLPAWVRKDAVKDEESVADVISCMKWVQQGNGNNAPDWLPYLGPGAGSSRRDRLESAWRVECARRENLRRLPAGLDQVAFGLAGAAEQERLLGLFDLWKGHLSATVFAELARSIDWRDVELWCREVFSGVSPVDLRDNTLRLLHVQSSLYHAQLVLNDVRPPSAGLRGRSVAAEAGQPSIGLIHIRQESPTLARPVDRKTVPIAGYPFVWYSLHVPFRLQSTGPYTAIQSIQVSYEDIPPVGIYSTAEIVASGSSRELQVRIEVDVDNWYKSTSGGLWHYDCTVEIPLGKSAATDTRLFSFKFKVAGKEHNLTFSRVAKHIPVVVQQADAVGRDGGDWKPLGNLQVRRDELAGRVCQASKSVLVVGPRRFGKSTLYGYLVTHAKRDEYKLLVIDPEAEAILPSKTPAANWEALEVKIGSELGMGRFELTEGGVPSARRFKTLRDFAKGQGYRAVLICVDEAQALFPAQNGVQWADALKQVLGDVNDVSMLLVGTPLLKTRAGNNFVASLDKEEAHSFTDDQLESFIKSLIGDHVTLSVGARTRLTRESQNIWVLVELLKRIASDLNKQLRFYVLTDDVRRAVDEAVDGRSQNLWDYVAANLSNQNDWDPVDAYPVAVAWAVARHESADFATQQRRAVEWLGEALHKADIAYVSGALAHRVRSGLEALRDKFEVLNSRWEFALPMLHRLLIVRAQDGAFATIKDLAVLERLAVNLIPVPTLPASALIGKGGQARVYRDGSLVWRISQFTQDGARGSFIRACASIGKLASQSSGEVGDESLPRIRHIGMTDDESNSGVMAYDWVDGKSLLEVMDSLNVNARLWVVCQVARALGRLHRLGLVHRDVDARNVLVDDSLKATLIDLGFAAPYGHLGASVVVNRNVTAPEVVAGGASTDRSDVYSLSALLAPGNIPAVPQSLLGLFSSMRSDKPENRPSADEVAGDIHEYLGGAGFNPARLVQECRVEQAIKTKINPIIGDVGLDWLAQLFGGQQFRPYLEQAAKLALGDEQWSVDSALMAAKMLNEVFGTWVHGSAASASVRYVRDVLGGEEASLNRIYAVSARRHDRGPWRESAVQFVGVMRNADSHRNSMLKNLHSVMPNYRYDSNVALRTYADNLKKVASILDREMNTAPRLQNLLDVMKP